MILVDTSAWYAALVPSDDNHTLARNYVRVVDSMAWHNPLSIAFEALGSVTGRILSFFFTCWFATGVASSVQVGGWPGSHFLQLPFLIGVPMDWLFLTLVSLLQGWGLLTLVFLGFAFVNLVHFEKSPVTCLLFVFVVQSMATLALMLQGVPWVSWPTRVKVFLAVWPLLVVLWILRLVLRGSTSRLGLLTRAVTWQGLEADDQGDE